MQKTIKEPFKMKVFPKGQVVIPITLRKKYQIAIGDQIEIIPESNGILLQSTPKEETDSSLTDRLFGIFSIYAVKKQTLQKKDIQKATYKGFVEEWAE